MSAAAPKARTEILVILWLAILAATAVTALVLIVYSALALYEDISATSSVELAWDRTPGHKYTVHWSRGGLWPRHSAHVGTNSSYKLRLVPEVSYRAYVTAEFKGELSRPSETLSVTVPR